MSIIDMIFFLVAVIVFTSIMDSIDTQLRKIAKELEKMNERKGEC